MKNKEVTIKKLEAKSNFKEEDLKHLKIVEEIRSGNVNAFDQLYDMYSIYLQHYCYQRIKDRQIAQDLTHEILTKIYLNIDKYTVEYTFNSWVWRLAKNYIVDYVRHSKINPINSNRNFTIVNQDMTEEAEMNSLSSSKIVSKEESAEDLMMDKKRKEYIDKLLSTMNERDRRILTMYYFEDKSYEEIANELDLKLNSMKVYLMRAKEKLKEKIGSFDVIADLITV